MKTLISNLAKSLLILFLTIISSACTEGKGDVLTKFSKSEKAEFVQIIERADTNSTEIEKAISECPPENFAGLKFLLKNMPDRDLKNLSSDFLLENIDYAYRVLDSVKWSEKIPNEIFLNYILPYANLHERRDNWRKDFYTKFLPLVKDLETPSEAVLTLNAKVWDIVNVHYSTKRPKADQSPYESIDAGLASCTGLSILLIDVCRAVGIPARFVGVPLWKDHSGNHSWVEIWDDGWHFIGADEQSPLDQTWFGERAKTADDSNWKYSIYANSFKKTDVVFPPLFDKTATYVYADIVTDRYSQTVADDGKVNLAVRLFDKPNGNRIIGKVKVIYNGEIIAEGETKDEKFDFNDFLIFRLDPDHDYKVQAEVDNSIVEENFSTDSSKYQFVALTVNK